MGLLRAQDRIHGAFATVISPSIQMLYDEQEIAFTVGHFSGFGNSGATLGPMEQSDWMSFLLNRNLMLRDMSLPAHFLGSSLVRPVCAVIGDEDLTSTGTDWIRRISPNNAWSGSGINAPPGGRSFAFAAADKRCHEGGLVVNPYSGQPTFHGVLYDLITEAVLRRGTPAAPTGAHPFPGPGISFDRDSDDGSEWVWARRHVPDLSGGALTEDTAFFDATQPGWAGTWLGKHEP